MNKKILHILAIIILAVLFGGMGLLVGKDSCVSSDTIKQNIMAELEQKLNLKIKDSLIPFFSKEKRISASLTGEILAIDVQANTLKIQVKNRYEGGDFFAYLNEPNSYIKTVKISGETEIVRQEMKEPEKFQDEIDEYNKDQTGLSPLPFKEISVSLKDLQKGTEVSVETDVAVNLKGSEGFDAKKITVVTDGNNDINNQDF